MIKINRVIWEDWNINHIAKHKVTQAEVEEVLHNKFIVRPTYRDRLLLIGKTENGRLISTVVHEDDKDTYYIITSRDATVSETRDYEEEINI